MQPETALSLCKALGEDHCLFGYSGNFSDEHSVRLIELVSALASSTGSAMAGRGRLGYVMVEAFQNIVRHRAETGNMAPWGGARSFFMLQQGGKGQRLLAENAVTRSQQVKLESLLQGLREKTAEELKASFMEGIQRTSAPGARGAGLGLIEMARRLEGKFRWRFLPIDERLARFTLVLDLGEPTETGAVQLEDTLLRRLALAHQWSLFFAGRWSKDIQLVLLKIAGAGAAASGQVDRLGTWLVHATPSFLVVQGGERRSLAMGGLMPAEGARLMGERTGLSPGNELHLFPVGDAVLALAQLEH